MNILLIGSEGALGKDLQKYLKKKNNLKLIDCINKKKYFKNYIKKDLTKKIKLYPFKEEKFDIAIILAFYKSQPNQFNSANRLEFKKKNEIILNNSLKISKFLNVKKIIYFSSAAVYANNFRNSMINENFLKKPSNIYGKFKLNAEKKIIKFGKKNNITTVNLRLFNYFNRKGENILISNFKKQIKKKAIFINSDGNQERDFLHVFDIFNALELIIKNKIKSGNYNLCSGNATTINKIVDQISKRKNIKKIYNPVNKTNYRLVGNNLKLKKAIKWKVTNNFNNIIVKL